MFEKNFVFVFSSFKLQCNAIFIITQDICIYMFPIAGQTARYPGGNIGLKIKNKFFIFLIFFISRATPVTLASVNKTICLNN